MPITEEALQHRYRANLDAGNWPEARYEWDILHGGHGRLPNPFDEADDKLDALALLAERRDYTLADEALRWLSDPDRVPAAYRDEEIAKYADIIDPVTRTFEDMDELELREAYADCLKLIEEIESEGWHVRGLDVRKARSELLIQVAGVRQSIAGGDPETAVVQMAAIPVERVKSDSTCLAKWVGIALETITLLIEYDQLDLAATAIQQFEAGGCPLSDDTAEQLSALKHACLEKQISSGRGTVGACLKEGDLDSAVEEAHRLLDRHKDVYIDYWPELGLIEEAVLQYRQQLKEADALKRKYEFQEALSLYETVPDSLRTCNVIVYESEVQSLRQLVQRKQNAEASIDRIQDELDLARMNKRFIRVHRLARELAQRIRTVSEFTPRLYNAQQIKSRLTKAEEQKQVAFKRALRAFLTGELLLLAILRQLRRN